MHEPYGHNYFLLSLSPRFIGGAWCSSHLLFAVSPNDNRRSHRAIPPGATAGSLMANGGRRCAGYISSSISQMESFWDTCSVTR